MKSSVHHALYLRIKAFPSFSGTLPALEIDLLELSCLELKIPLSLEWSIEPLFFFTALFLGDALKFFVILSLEITRSSFLFSLVLGRSVVLYFSSFTFYIAFGNTLKDPFLFSGAFFSFTSSFLPSSRLEGSFFARVFDGSLFSAAALFAFIVSIFENYFLAGSFLPWNFSFSSLFARVFEGSIFAVTTLLDFFSYFEGSSFLVALFARAFIARDSSSSFLKEPLLRVFIAGDSASYLLTALLARALAGD